MARILIIEDDMAIAAIERDYLEIDCFEVEIVSDGVKGLERGLSGEFDLILLDLMLPGMDGFSVCRRLREKSTEWSVVFNQGTGEVHYFHRENYENKYVFTVKREGV